jgi:hypothetical protein
MNDRPDYAWWSAAIAGEKPATYETAECGYFKMRDRRGLNKDLAPIKRPWIACAIWRDPTTGELMAERAGTACDVDALWPWCAKYPIEYDDYAYWHLNEKFPEVAA